MKNIPGINRRRFLTGMTAVAAAGGAAAVGLTASSSAVADDGPSPDVGANSDRLEYHRFPTNEIAWDPGINVLLPDGYHSSGKHYPVLYLLHGGASDFTEFHVHHDIIGLTAGRELIVVMPDASTGWYSNPVSSLTGPRNWENFHINQLIPWVEANYRTFPEFDGRAVAGFSMGGFGALKYTAKYYGHFCSTSSHSGPASLRRDGGIVVHWANATSAALDLGGGMVYGAPWDEARVSADNPMERIESYRGKRIFLAAGTRPEPVDWFADINEWQVLEGQREFRAALDTAGIEYEAHEFPDSHRFQRHLFSQDLDGMLARLRTAA